MEYVEVHAKRTRLLIQALVTLALALGLALAWWFLMLPADDLDGEGMVGLYVAPVVVGFMALGGSIWLSIALNKKPLFVIHSDHLDLTEYGGPLPLSAITRIEHKVIGVRGPILSIETTDEAERLSRSSRGARLVAWTNRLTDCPSFSFGTNTIHPPIDVIAWHFRERGVEIEGATPKAPVRYGG